MKQLPKTSGELWKTLLELKSAEELIPIVYRQLEKDFEQSHIPLPFSESEPALNWISILSDLLQRTADEPVRRLLYRVDVPEQLVVQEQNSGYFSGLAEVIIYRELVKVYFKLNYSA